MSKLQEENGFTPQKVISIRERNIFQVIKELLGEHVLWRTGKQYFMKDKSIIGLVGL